MGLPLTVFGFLGTVLDRGEGAKRWEKWRPTLSLVRQEDLLVKRLVLFRGDNEFEARIAEVLEGDVRTSSPETEVVWELHDIRDPWNFAEVFSWLHGFTRRFGMDPEKEEFLVHISTGTHVAQICLFLLTESRHFPARLVQTSPPKRGPRRRGPGTYQIIDLDLSRYDQIAARFFEEQQQGLSLLKSGIETRNEDFNRQIAEIEMVALASEAPILLLGPTGAGKSRLAAKIYELKKGRKLVSGPFVEVNCATLRGDQAMSGLFGHARGAFTGAAQARGGLLARADGGMLFLDEIGELGLDEQAMLLRAIEEKRFLPLGSDEEVESDFQLIAGSNRDLYREVEEGNFRQDLLARIDLWAFELPSLKERWEDIEPNLEFELRRFSSEKGRQVRFNKEARERYLDFALSEEARWTANFRDLGASITRLCTLSPGGRIQLPTVEKEIERLRRAWQSAPKPGSEAGGDSHSLVEAYLPSSRLRDLDPFDRFQLEGVLAVCRRAKSLSEAGRELFAQSRRKKQRPNDADRLRKYLLRFGLRFQDL